MTDYLVATIKPWNLAAYSEIISHYPGRWHLAASPDDLTVERVKSLTPRYIFFPHWSERVSSDILALAECVCFHATNVPYGRGGSPIQNLIASGSEATVISALRMTDELDAGAVYLRRPLSLLGLAEEIFIRSSRIVASMILEIIVNNPVPEPQTGEATIFRRRTPEMSRLPQGMGNLSEVFDHIRMLDAESYPRAFIQHGGLRISFSRPALYTGRIAADAEIRLLGESDER